MEFEAESVAIEAAAVVLRLARKLPADLDFLRDQVQRAACSAALNLSEGKRRNPNSRAYHFRVAHGSASEAKTALAIATRAGVLDASEALALLDRVAAMTWRLMRR